MMTHNLRHTLRTFDPHPGIRPISPGIAGGCEYGFTTAPGYKPTTLVPTSWIDTIYMSVDISLSKVYAYD